MSKWRSTRDVRGRAPGDSRERFTALLPPAALACVLLSAAAPALASAGFAYANTGNFPGITNADGFRYTLEAPDPNLGQGARDLSHTRAYFRQWDRFNGVGYYNWDSPSNRRLALQIADDSGNYIYATTTPNPYQAYDSSGQVRAWFNTAMWRSSGNWWYFQWWGPGFNTYVYAYNSHGSLDPKEATMGLDSWGACPNSYEHSAAYAWSYRDKGSGSWYSFPAAGICYWGTSPTVFAYGDGANGNPVYYESSCP